MRPKSVGGLKQQFSTTQVRAEGAVHTYQIEVNTMRSEATRCANVRARGGVAGVARGPLPLKWSFAELFIETQR